MRALTLNGDQDIRFEAVPDPTIERSTDAVVKIALCAVCGSDLHPYNGKESGYDQGMVPGHEFVGEVVAVGSDVDSLLVGDRVHAPFSTSCGTCRACRSGLTARCVHGQLLGWRQNGEGLNGGQAEYIRVPLADGTLVAIADGLSDITALLLGDVFSTGYHGALMAESGPERTIAVVGCGPVGLMAVIGAIEQGAERVVAFDLVEDRLRLAASFGAEVSEPLSQEALCDLFKGGADGVVEAVGSERSTRMAFDLLRPGGVLSSVGVHTRPEFGFTPVEAYDKNLTLRMGRCSARTLMERLIPVATSGRYDLEAIVTHRMTLADGADAYEMVANRQDGCAKVVLEV